MAQRGEVWFIEPDFVEHNEQSGLRPAIVVSDDRFNATPLRLRLVVPVTTRLRGWRTHVPLQAGEGGLSEPGEAMVEHLRSIGLARFRDRVGRVKPVTMDAIEHILRTILRL